MTHVIVEDHDQANNFTFPLQDILSNDNCDAFQYSSSPFKPTPNTSEKKGVYLSFYSPIDMSDVPFRETKKIIGFFTFLNFLCTIVYNTYALFLQHVMQLNNEFTVRMTMDQEHPDIKFSHVEISTDSDTYFIKWGGTFERLGERLLSSKKYGVVFLPLSDEDCRVVVDACEYAYASRVKFNYIGSIVNFVLPRFVRIRLFGKEAVYKTQKARFCSEFIAEALSLTKAYSKYFGEEGEEDKVKIQLTSPTGLFILLLKHQKNNPSDVVFSNHNLKRQIKTKKVIKTSTTVNK